MRLWITWALFFVAFVYNILDAWHTKLLLSLGATELNPIMNYCIQNFGVDSLFSVKILFFMILGIVLYEHQLQFKKKERRK